VELHGGSVAASSEGEGRGAEFLVELPLAPAQPAPQAPAPPPPARGRRVLLVDDNRDAAESLCALLELAGHQVAIAHGGAEGLARAREWGPDVVLCDIGLPDMDGYEVARRLRAEPALRGVLLVALSGYALDEDLRRAREAGFDAHEAKPASLDRLLEIIGSAGDARSQPA
jgi:two-component system CheB/CheR fusion protein